MIIVTGATGTIGRELVTQLTKQNTPFRAVVRSELKAKLVGLPLGSFEICDLADKTSIGKIFKGASTLFLLTPLHDENLALQHSIFDAALKNGVKHVVKIGTILTDKDNRIAHARWHQEMEDKIQKSGITWTLIRPTLFNSIIFEPWARTQNGQTITLPLRNGRIPFVDPRDVALVAAKALVDSKLHGKTYSLTGPESLSLEQVSIILSKSLNQNYTYTSSTPEAFIANARRFGIAPWLVQDLVELFEYFAHNRGSTLALPPPKILEKATAFRDTLGRLGTHSFHSQRPARSA